MVELIEISATQIENFKRCQRYWAWQKIAGITTPRTKSLELGSRVHDILDSYYRGESSPNLAEVWSFSPGSKLFYPGKIASQMISKAVPASVVPFIKSEMPFKNTRIGQDYGVIYTGKIDVHWTAASKERWVYIVDHKTSSDPEKWGKKLESLEYDTQRILYARVCIDLYMATQTSFILNYGSTLCQKSKNYFVECRESANDVIRQFEINIEPFAIAMAEAKRLQASPLAFEANPDACGMFGGCPFTDRCRLTPGQRIGALIMGNETTIDEILARVAKSNARKTAQAAPPEQVAENPAAPPEQVAESPVNPPEQVAESPVNPPEQVAESPTTKKRTTKKAAKKTVAVKTSAESPVEVAVAGPCPGKYLTETEVNRLKAIIEGLSGFTVAVPHLKDDQIVYVHTRLAEVEKILEKSTPCKS
jgi:hypothetical protein